MTVPSSVTPRKNVPGKLERELCGRLGLEPGAAPEDVSAAHEAVSAYLAAAPRDLRGWARVQAHGADEAYQLLTDPVAFARAAALVGASARPAVVPSEAATPPARREPLASAAAAPAVAAERKVAAGASPALTDDELDDLLAEVDPSAHRETARSAAARPAVAAPAAGGLLASSFVRRLVVVGVVAVALVVGANFVYNMGASAPITGSSPTTAPAGQATNPPLDTALVAQLMQKIAANPKDAVSLLALGNAYFDSGDYATAADWFRKATVADPTNVPAFIGLGTAAFNNNDSATAATAWNEAVRLDPKNVEGHYDLGFLYLNQTPPDMAGVQREWGLVVQLAPNSDVAKTVQAHLTALSSAAPFASPAASGAASAAPSGAASPAASGAPTPAPSAAPSGLPTP